MSFLKRLVLILLFGAIFAGVIYFVPAPSSWAQASVVQILAFFIPLLLFLTFLANLYARNILKSFSLALGFMVLIVLKSIDSLNPVTFTLVAVATILLATSFRSTRIVIRRKR